MSKNNSHIAPEKFHKIVPLSRIVIRRLIILFSSLVLVFSLVTYMYMIKETEIQFQEQLLEYIDQRGQRESELFQLAEDNLNHFKEDFIFHYENNPKRDFNDWFVSHMTRHRDGTRRSLAKYFAGVWTTGSTFAKGITIIMAPEVKLNEEIQRRIAIAYQEILIHGPVWRSRFVNLWFVAPEKIFLTYWPEVPWCLNMPADYKWEAEEWFYGTCKKNNPQRKMIWTDTYFDAPANRWMISSALPIDINGKQIGTIGTDIYLDEMFERTLSDNPIISHSIILGQQGQVIVQSEKKAEIREAGGTPLPVVCTSDILSQSLFDKVKSTRSFPVIIDDVEHNQFLAVSRIEGPDWYLISVSPKTIFKNKILQNTWFMLAVVVGILIAALFMIYWVVRKDIAQPLGLLTEITKRIGHGKHENIPQDMIVQGEIGELALAFNDMSKQIIEREKALFTSKEEWERTFDAITDIVSLQTPDLRILKINKIGCKVFGISCEEANNQYCYELFHNKTNPYDNCPLLETQKNLVPCTQEMYFEKLNKTYLVSAAPVLDKVGKLINIVHVAKDITFLKKMSADRLRLAAAIDQASETVVVTDTDGSIQYVNPAFEKLTGYSREEAIGQNPRVLKSGRHDQKFYEKMWSELLAGRVWKGHLVNKKKDGSLFEEEASISPVKNDQGVIVNYVAVKHDVSKEVLLEKQLRQAMKMEAIGTLAGGIAHDFNNILSAIIGYTEIAKEQLPVADPIEKDLDQVLDASRRATELVKQILTFSRHGEEDFKSLKVQLIVKEVLKLLRASLPTTIQLKKNIDPNTGSILADPTQMHQVLMNLCTNAKHAIGFETGTLTVSLSEIQITEEKPIGDCPQMMPGRYLDLEISDTGCGMDELTRVKIFDPFFTTKEKGEGTGLGLSVVHGIVKQHNGEITVTSDPGHGTTFNIYIPVISDEVVQTDRATLKDIPRGEERILFVDDEAVIGEMMQRILEKLGYSVTIFSSSIKALEAYQENPGDFDLVITDMTMPEMTGIELSRKLLAIQQDLPIILCTGFSEATDESTTKSSGIREYIEKPVDIFTLAKAIRSALVPYRLFSAQKNKKNHQQKMS